MKKIGALTSVLFLNSLTGNSIEQQTPIQSTETYVTQSDDQSFDDLFEKGNVSFKNQDYTQASYYFTKALHLHPTCPHAHFNLGQSYYWAKNYEAALHSFKNTIKLDNTHVNAFAQIGQLFWEVSQYDSAIPALKKTLQLDPEHTQARLTLIRSYNQLQKFDCALKLLYEGLQLNPNDLNLQFELANTYTIINKLEEALVLYKKLNTLVPYNPSILYNLAFTLKKIGRVEESLTYYDAALALNPDHNDAKFSRGLAYLVLGDFEKGWAGYECRYQRSPNGLRSFTQPRWQGEDLSNKTILIHSEQGFGDTLQFIRYAQLLKKQNVRVIAAVQPALVTLISLCPYIDYVVSINQQNLPLFDVQAPIMSLAYIMQTRLDTVPDTIPYLYADEQLTQEWKEKLASDPNFKIGICVQGNENYATPNLRMTVAQKSVKAEQLAPICAIPGVSVYSLQKNSGTAQFETLPENMHIITFEGDFDNSHGRFMDTAAVIENLDLVVTVDTSISHLSGGLGTLTWIMLPNPADWRWMINRTDSPWYPDVVRLFKQPTPGDWKSMIEEVAREIVKLMESKK